MASTAPAEARGVPPAGRAAAPSPPTLPAGDEHEPPLESLVHLRYAHHRRLRNRRIRHRQESVLAKYRFWIMLAVLLGLAAAFTVGSLHEVQHLFGI